MAFRNHKCGIVLLVSVLMPLWCAAGAAAASLDVKLMLSRQHFEPGDRFSLEALVVNPGPAKRIPLAVALEIRGSFWFWPSWQQMVETGEVDLRPGWNRISIIPEFPWPETGVTMDGLKFFAVLLTSDLQAPASNVASTSFSFASTLKNLKTIPEAYYRTGQLGPQTWMLPNGRLIKPSGRLVPVDNLSLAVAVSPDGRYATSSNSGQGRQSLQTIDLQTGAVVDTKEEDALFLGLAFSPDGTKLYASGGEQQVIAEYRFRNGALSSRSTIAVQGFPGGLCLSPDGRNLYFVSVLTGELNVVDTGQRQVVGTVAVGANPYTVIAHPSVPEVYVSVEGADQVAVVDVSSPTVPTLTKSISVQKNPEGLALNPEGLVLYVANADEDSVSVINLTDYRVRETLDVRAPGQLAYGTTPNHLAFSPDGSRLYISQASDNRILAWDLTAGKLLGAIPAAWYPSTLAIAPDGKTLVAANLKGIGTAEFASLGIKNSGIIQIAPIPDDDTLKANHTLTEDWNRIPGRLFTPVDPDHWTNPVPLERGGRSPIKHVFLVVRENKTYDSMLGDWAKGDGDPSKCLFCYEETPNLHALLDRFSGGDNYYVSVETSLQGHEILTATIVNSFMEKAWSQRGREATAYVDSFLNRASFPKNEFVFQNCLKNGVSFRNYGEAVGCGIDNLIFDERYVHWGPYDPPVFYPLSKDVDKLTERIAEWETMVEFPQFIFMLFPNDHGLGASYPFPTLNSMVADNDEATGKFIEWLSQSKYWKESLVFVIEDDSQQGKDHVDLHRSPLLVVSPWVKRGYVSPIHYTEANMHATIEHVLNLPPLGIYDEIAQPMWDIFTEQADFTPYKHLPRKYPEETNPPGTSGAAASQGMNFLYPDAAERYGQLVFDLQKERQFPLEERQQRESDYHASQAPWLWYRIFIEQLGGQPAPMPKPEKAAE